MADDVDVNAPPIPDALRAMKKKRHWADSPCGHDEFFPYDPTDIVLWASESYPLPCERCGQLPEPKQLWIRCQCCHRYRRLLFYEDSDGQQPPLNRCLSCIRALMLAERGALSDA